MNNTSESRWGCGRSVVVVGIVLLAGGSAAVWQAMRPIDTTPPKAVLDTFEPNAPLFAEHEEQVTFVLHDEQGGIPTFYVFQGKNQKSTATGINSLRGTPNERGVEIRLEALRFRRDADDPDILWVRVVGIAHETEGKTPISRSRLERGEPLEIHFHDEIEVPYLTHVIYDIDMTIRYTPKTQQLTLSHASGSVRWQMLGTDAFDEGQLAQTLVGQKGQYAEKPFLKL